MLTIDEPDQLEDGRCPSCDQPLVEEELELPVCRHCDRRIERELAAYLEFVAVCRELA